MKSWLGVLMRLDAVRHLGGGGKWHRFHRGAMDSWPLSAGSPIPAGNLWSGCPRKYCSEPVRSSACHHVHFYYLVAGVSGMRQVYDIDVIQMLSGVGIRGEYQVNSRIPSRNGHFST